MTIVRPYEEADLAGVLSAWENASRLAHPFLSEAFLAQERRDLSAVYMPVADTWVVEADGHVVGFISLSGNEVGGLFLQPAYHGRGMGKLLMDKAQALHRELELEVFEKNAIGRRFYARYGFAQIGESLHEQTEERMLRLRFSAGDAAPQKPAVNQ